MQKRESAWLRPEGGLPDDAPVVGLIGVGGDAVIGVHPVGHRLTVRRKTPEGEGGVVQQRSVGGRLPSAGEMSRKLWAAQ